MTANPITTVQGFTWSNKDIERPDNSGMDNEILAWTLTNFQPGSAAFEIVDGKYTFNPGEKIKLNNGSLPVLVRLKGHPVYVSIELPLSANGRAINWKFPSTIESFVTFIKRYCGTDFRNPLFLPKLMKKFYYHKERDSQPVLYPIMTIGFPTQKAADAVMFALSRPVNVYGIGNDLMFKVHERKIDNIRRLLTERSVSAEGNANEITYSGWFHVETTPVPQKEKISTLEHEYYAKWNSMTGIDQSQSQNWVVRPRLFSYDLEAYSPNHNAFPVAYSASHVVYMISGVVQVIGKPSNRRYLIMITGDIDPINLANTGHIDYLEKRIKEEKDNPDLVARLTQIMMIAKESKMPVDVYRYNDEGDLINGLMDMTRKYNVDILTGYNIHIFDNWYMNKRHQNRSIKWSNGSRLLRHQVTASENSWESSGAGINDNTLLDLPGVVSFDLFTAIKRQFKLRRYDLSTVGQRFIKRKKHDVSAKRMFEIYEDYLIGRAMLNKVFPGLIYTQVNPNCNTVGQLESIVDQIDWTQQIHYSDLLLTPLQGLNPAILKSVLLDYARARTQFTEVAAYAVRDAELVVDIFMNLNMWLGLVEMSNAVGVPIEELYTRGQQKRGYSLIYNLASRMGYIIDSASMAKEPYSGAFVFDPIPGYFPSTICLDFKSLYPSIMMAYNICYTTIIPKESMEWYRANRPNDVHIIEWDDEIAEGEEAGKKKSLFDVILDSTKEKRKKKAKNADARNKGKVKKVHYCFMFLKAEVKKGVLPQLVDQLVTKRREVVALAKTIKDPIIKAVLNERQNALKIMANSLYGLLGVDKGIIPLIEGAMCITARGRVLIESAANYVRRNYGATVVYGDTDSVMFQMNGKNPRYNELTTPIVYNLTEYETIEHILEALKDYSIHATVERTENMANVTMQEFRQILTNYTANTILPTHIRVTNPPPVVDMDGKSCWVWGERLEHEISATFPNPLYTEFEKCGDVFTVTKKRYIFWKLKKTGERSPDEKDIIVKGLILARRDGAEWQMRVYNKMVHNIMEGVSMRESLRHIIRSVDDMYRYRVPVSDVQVVKGMGASFASDTYFMKVFGDEMAKLGRPIHPGDRVDYVIVITKDEYQPHPRDILFYNTAVQRDPEGVKFGAGCRQADVLLGKKMRTPEVFEERRGTDQEEKIDVLYYIEHVLMNCVEQIFYAGYKEELDKLEAERNIGTYHMILDRVYQTRPNLVNVAYQRANGDLSLAHQYMVESKIPDVVKTIEKARKELFTGRSAFDLRLSKNPIKQMIKAIRRGLYMDLIKTWDPELFEELYPTTSSNLPYICN